MEEEADDAGDGGPGREAPGGRGMAAAAVVPEGARRGAGSTGGGHMVRWSAAQ